MVAGSHTGKAIGMAISDLLTGYLVELITGKTIGKAIGGPSRHDLNPPLSFRT